MSDPFIGTIMPCPYTFAPRFWAFCQGQELQISQNQALFSLIGTIYGGDGRTTFNLPDLRSRQPLGAGRGPGLSTYEIGNTGGSEHKTLDVANLPEHSHETEHTLSASLKASTEDGTETTPASNLHLAEIDLNRSRHDSTIYGTGPMNAAVGGGEITGQITCGNAGNGEQVDNRAPFMAMNYVICLFGIFPSRN